MYSYTWDTETGGLLLNSTPLKFSKEPRPVYYKELDTLGFNEFWQYPHDNERPIMWAEATNYIYKGRVIGKIHGGSLYNKPTIDILEEHPEGAGNPLVAVDIIGMIHKKENMELMEVLVNATIKRVYNTYKAFRNRVDVFHVSFSGGKDSIVLLDIVARALPHTEFFVVFGDTQMEFPDTYDTVVEIEKWCKKESVKFLRARSHLNIMDSWKTFGPPSNVLRWCCSVHKTAPQLMALRKATGKTNVRDMAFVGVRADESINRSEYDFVSFGKKHSGQYSTHPILEWNSAELYLYIFSNGLIINPAYKKGVSRVGCILCPMSQSRNEFIRNKLFPDETGKFMRSIEESYGLGIGSKHSISNLENGGWKQRKNGKMIVGCPESYSMQIMAGEVLLHIANPKTDWKTWMQTLGKLEEKKKGEYTITFKGEKFSFNVKDTRDGYEVVLPLASQRSYPTFSKVFKQVFKKAASCIKCGECVANCPNNCIKMNAGFKIENCVNCLQCHSIDDGCLLYHATNIPIGGSGMEKSKSIDCYSGHGPKKEWLIEFFKKREEFFENNGLGSVQLPFFKRFLRDTGLIAETKFSNFANVVNGIGFDTNVGLGLILINGSYSPQIGCYVRNTFIGQTLTRQQFVEFLIRFGLSENSAPKTVGSFKRLSTLFEPVGFGHNIENGKILESITRGKWQNPEPLVVLYGLYKFSEACGGNYQFSLSRLFDFSIESQGISPAQIFGLDKNILASIISGLASKYPEFIGYSDTLGLETVDLRKGKTSKEVLDLF